MAFSATGKAPGVYIDEIQVPGAIPGVGTSTAAFVGPARRGPLFTPREITNWSQFIAEFGEQDDLGPYIPNAAVYVTHAVRGFFDNGGARFFFVRVGTAARAARTLNDRGVGPAARPVLIVTAKQEGAGGNGITVEVQDANIVASVAVARAQATLASASNNTATVTAATDAANFKPGDIVSLTQGASTERATVSSVNDVTIRFETNLTNTYTGGTIRIGNLIPGQKKVRIAATTGIEPGSSVTFTQGGTTESKVVQSVELVGKFINLTTGLTQTYAMDAADPAVSLKTNEFTLKIAAPGAGVETFEKLSFDPRHSRYINSALKSDHVDVTIVDPPSPALTPNNLPAVLAATALASGQNDDVSQIQTADYVKGIDALRKIDDVSILCVPDRTDQSIQVHMIKHCEEMQDRFAILDPLRNADAATVKAQRTDPAINSKGGYAALYYPWIIVANPIAEGRISIPPSGHVAGLYARTDNSRGVWKAPANESLRGVVTLERILADEDQGPLNDEGINVIRAFPGSGILVWGARTITPKSSTQWRYVNVRRLLLFIEESIQEGTRFAVFEPHELGLWKQVKRQVEAFLTNLWQQGALFGKTAEEAFQVRVDEELNPASQRQLGILTIEVKLYPTTPAEFVVFRIIQQPGGPLVQE